MSNVTSKIKEEFLAVIPPTLFFFVAVHIVAVVRVLMAKGSGYTPLSTISQIFFGPLPVPAI